MRAMARTGGGQMTLVEVKAVDDAYPLFGKVVSDPDMPLPALLAEKGRCVRRWRRSRAAGPAQSQSRRPHHHRQRHDRAARRADQRARSALGRYQPRPARAHQRGGAARHRTHPARQPGALAIPAAAPGRHERWRRGGDPQRSAVGLPRRRLGDPHARQGVAAARAQRRTFHPIPHAGRVDHAARRRRRCRECGRGAPGAQARRDRHDESARRQRRRHFRDLLRPDFAVALFATAIGAGIGAALPFAISWWFGAIIPLPVAPSLHPSVLVLSICYGMLTALAFALWPLGRAHDISVSMLFRDQIAAERAWPRPRYVIATALVVAVFAALATLTTYDHRIAANFYCRRRRHFPRAADRRAAGHGHRPAFAASAFDDAAARHRQHPPARRADARRHAVARPWTGLAHHGDRDRRQSAPRVLGGAAGESAIVFPSRHRRGRRPTLRRLRARAGARLDLRTRARCCAAASSRQTASRRTI